MGKPSKTNTEINAVIRSRGGIWISGEYSNRRTSLLKIKCSEAHTWETTYNSLHKGRWCPECGRLSMSLKQSIPDSEKHKLANERKGLWLDRILEPGEDFGKDRWQCARGHTWPAKLSHVKNNGTWCPYCKTSVGENLVRMHFEAIFKKSFPKSKPKWLIADKNTRLELDGYCNELQLAFEYNHHATHNKEHILFSKKMPLAKRQKLDLLKSELCAKNSVRLIVIDGSATSTKVSLEELRIKILEEIRANGIEIQNVHCGEINYNYAHIPNDYLKDLQFKATENGGWCLSTSCPYSDSICKFECQDGHIWSAYSNNIRRGSWCPVCAGNTIGNLEELHVIAKRKEGRCLADKYKGRHEDHEFECKLKHVFKKTPDKLINRGQWCKLCATFQWALLRRQKTYEKALQISMAKGGRCLNDSYDEKNQKLIWECVKKHIWPSKISNIIHGRWCPKCSGVAHRRLEEMQRRSICANMP